MGVDRRTRRDSVGLVETAVTPAPTALTLLLLLVVIRTGNARNRGFTHHYIHYMARWCNCWTCDLEGTISKVQ